MASVNCKKCGAEYDDMAAACPQCGQEPERSEPLSYIVPYKNPKALIGYYLAVFSLIPVVGLALGPAALILGALGLRDRARNPGMHGLAHAVFALVLGALVTLGHVAAIIAIVASASR